MVPNRRTTLVWLGLAVVLLAVCVRSLGLEWVFVDPETVVLPPADAQYHMRRVLYGWTNFPFVLFSDPYINFPGGAAISWPPLFDFTVAATGRLLTADPASFQRLAAWAPVLIGTLTLLPVYAVGRRLGGARLGLGAAGLLAMFPMSVTYSRVGQLDHHVAVAAIGACLLATCARLADERSSTAAGAGLAAGRIAMLLTWHGSLLYLALVELTLWFCAAVTGRRDLYAVQAVSAMVTLIVLAPLVWLFPEPLGGAYSAIALSRLHVIAIAIVVIVSAGMWLYVGRKRGSALGRLGWTIALALGALAFVLVLPGTREGIEPAVRFLTMRDGVGFRTGEQLPLFAIFGRETGRPVWEVWGLLGYAIPLLPFAVAWAAPAERRASALVVAGWCAWFGALALVQRRYGNDLGPAAAVGTALVLAELGRRLSATWKPGRLAGVVAVGLGLVVLAPPLFLGVLPQTFGTFRALRDSGDRSRALSTVAGSLTRFLEQVRTVTPETSGYFDVRQEPEYGIVAQANFGHALQNVAHRPTPTDPFWAFIGRENWNAAFGLLDAKSERRAVALAKRLEARYVMTHSGADPEALEGWLHHADGRRVGPWTESQHFRLVTEGPDTGVHFFARSFEVRGRRIRGGTPPYKLFEVVEGALLEVPALPGDEVTAALQLRTVAGRHFEYRAKATAEADGIARLRVPYPSLRPEIDTVVAASGPYRLETNGGVRAVAVSESDVRSGATLRAEMAPR